MEFNALIKSHLLPILQKYQFDIAEEFKNVVRFQSSSMKLNVVFNDYDMSHLVEIGKLGDILYPLNNRVVKELIFSELAIEQVSSEAFIQNLSFLFKQNNVIEILKGNVEPLEKFIKEQSKMYTSELIEKQALETASFAWKANDFETFVKSIDKIGIEKTPQSYQLKYKIAKRKLQR